MAYIKQGFVDEVKDEQGNIIQEGTVLKAEHLINLENAILENAENIEAVKGNDGPLNITGDTFVDGQYYYTGSDSKVASIKNSSKMAAHSGHIEVFEGQLITIKIFTSATAGYIFADDSDTIIATGQPTGNVITLFAPNGATRLYVNTLKTEKANSYVLFESSSERADRLLSNLVSAANRKYLFDPVFDLSKVPTYELPAKSVILSSQSNDIYNQYDALVEAYPNYVTKIDCDAEMVNIGVEKPEHLADLPIYMYKFSPTRTRNSSGKDPGSKKKIFITSMHPQEKFGMWVMAKTLTMICEDWKNNYDVELVRSLVDIYVLPLAWIWNYNNNSRKNYNGINPNRSFPTKNWYVSGEGTHDYTGEEAGSEYESKLIMHFFHSIKPDVTIDVHTSGHDRFGCMGLILCPSNDLNRIDLYSLIARTTTNAAIKDNPLFALNDPDLSLYGVYPEAAPPPGEFYQWANEQGYGIAILTEESPYCNWQDGEFLGADGSFIEEYTPNIFRQQIQYLFNCILRLTKYQC